MVTRALVLGGGGPVGIAWETGLLWGLQQAGVDVSNADTIIGTSAGSVVGTQIALGTPLAQLAAAQTAPVDAVQEPPITFDPSVLLRVGQTMMLQQHDPQAMLSAIGQIALATPTVAEATYLQRFAAVRGIAWPQRRLRITAVNAENGAFVVWERDAGVPLQEAVGSSCAVPGIFPPVTIDGQRYMDGGMRSSTNGDLASEHDRVLLITPIVQEAAGVAPGTSRLAREVAQLRAAGSQVLLLAPDQEALRAFGDNLMDIGRRAGAAQAGVRQGAAAAASVRALWE